MSSPRAAGSGQHWIAQHSHPIIFLILTLGLLGAYLAFTIPVSVFPATNFPRVLIGVDNGVMPIDQMMVTVTRPIEEAVNSVPGLLTVRSITVTSSRSRLSRSDSASIRRLSATSSTRATALSTCR